MDRTSEFRGWIASQRDLCFDLVRVYLGIGLFVKGLQFVADREFLAELLQRSGEMPFLQTFMLHYIPIAHLGGGALLAAGLLTRISALFQIPILAGAVFLIHIEEGLFTKGQNLEFAALVLYLLILLVIHGGGRLSFDHYLRRGQLQRPA